MLFSFSAGVSAEDDDSSFSSDIPSWAIEFIKNPDDFFFNIHTNNEDFSPLPSDRNGSIRFNFLPTFLPFTLTNLNAKAKILNDKGYVPQVDLIGEYGDLLALRIASSSMEDVKPTFSEYSYGMIVSKAASKGTKIFGGYKYSKIKLSVKLSSGSVIDVGTQTLEELDINLGDSFFVTGIQHETSPENFVVGQISYGFKEKKLISRIMISKRHLELGMDVCPESLLVIHPFLAWHWYF